MGSFKEKFVDGIVIGMTSSIMIIFVGFIWQQALSVGDILIAVEDNIVEVIDVLNTSNDKLMEDIVTVKNTLQKEIAAVKTESIDIEQGLRDELSYLYSENARLQNQVSDLQYSNDAFLEASSMLIDEAEWMAEASMEESYVIEAQSIEELSYNEPVMAMAPDPAPKPAPIQEVVPEPAPMSEQNMPDHSELHLERVLPRLEQYSRPR